MAKHEVYQALADATRRRILSLLRERGMTAGEIAQQFEMSWPSISRHLGVLQSAGLVSSEKLGPNVHYSLAGTSQLEAVAGEISALFASSDEPPDDRYLFFERYNDHVRRALASAQHQAQDLGHQQVEVPHLLIGLLSVSEGEAQKCLNGHGLEDATAVREHVRTLYERGPSTELPPFSAAVKRIMEAALVEAGKVGHTYAGSGPLLLALLAETSLSPSAEWTSLVNAFGVDPVLVRESMLRRLQGYAAPHAADRPTGMFERFTDRARRVIVLAQEEARMLDHNYIGTEHLLLGLVHEDQGTAAQALIGLGLDLDRARALVEERIGRGTSKPQGHIPFTPRSKKVLEASLREALELGHNHISTEHILLGLLREGEGVAAAVLRDGLGLSLNKVRQAVLKALGEPAEAATATLLTQQIDALTLAQALETALSPLVERLREVERKLGDG